jgi:hypothetical protein
MFRKTPLLLILSIKRKEEEKRNPRGILSYYTSFPYALKDSRGISAVERFLIDRYTTGAIEWK